jgi:hypothetical protein
LELNREDPDLVRFRVPLFALWLKEDGRAEVRQQQVVRGNLVATNSITAAELISATEGLSYKGRTISTHEVEMWLDQFGSTENQRLILRLLSRLRERSLLTQEKFIFAVRDLHRLALLKAAEHGIKQSLSARKRLSNWYATHGDRAGKSGGSLLYTYRIENPIPYDNSGQPEQVAAAISKREQEQVVLVCVNDFVGSGRSAVDELKQVVIPALEDKVDNWRERVLVIYATLMGFETGLGYIDSQMASDVRLVCGVTLSEADKAFSPDSGIFLSAEDRIRANDLVRTIGLALEKRQPLGYEDSQALIVFPENVPNNTLPIFYKSDGTYKGQPWKALFPRS